MASHRGGKYTPKMGGDGTGGVQELGGGGWWLDFCLSEKEGNDGTASEEGRDGDKGRSANQFARGVCPPFAVQLSKKLIFDSLFCCLAESHSPGVFLRFLL